MKLVKILNEIVDDLKKQGRYSAKNFVEENLYESYILLAELLNPNDSYEYEETKKGIWEYTDSSDNIFFVRFTYQPLRNPYFEIKTWWLDESGRKIYDHLPDRTSAIDWDKRSNTVAKIFRDEIIPEFAKQDYTNKMIFKPVSESRYYFSLRMIQKFIPKEWKITENFPREIMIEKE